MTAGAPRKRIETRAHLERVLAAIGDGVRVGFAAMNVATGEVVEWEAERPLPTASVFKLPLLVEVYRQAAAGALDLDERVSLRAEDVVMGSGILRDFQPGLRPTLRDLATMMIVVSDNGATNLLLDRVGGPERINATMRDLGLPSIVVHRRIAFGEIAAAGDLAEAAPRDMMRLAAWLAREELVSAEASRAMLGILARQRHLDQAPRFVAYRPYAADFGLDQRIAIANKTGFMRGLRADAGVIALGPEARIAYSMVSDAGDDDTYRHEHPADIANALIGRALVEYWLPAGWRLEDAVYPSPYVDRCFTAAGL